MLLNLKTNKILKIEVKTRQTLYTTATSKNTENKRQFQVSDNEYKEMDLLICYWFDYNSYFIIPKSELEQNKTTKRLNIKKNKDGNFGTNEKYLNNWENLKNMLF